MCYYIIATLHGSVRVESIASIFDSHGLGFRLIPGPDVASDMEPGDWQILTTTGHCDCDTAIGSNQAEKNQAEKRDRKLKALRKQGWSEAKIRRWLAQKEETAERHRTERAARAEASTPDLDEWIAFINDVLASGQTERLGLLLHWYGGASTDEPVRIVGREVVTLAELNPERLVKMKEDVLCEFVR